MTRYWLRDLLAAVACTAVIAGTLLTRGGIWEHVGGADLHGEYIPRFVYAAEAVRALRLPLWNPFEFCGTPLLGSGQGVLYPPVLVLFGTLTPWTALQAFYALHLFVLAWGGIALLGAHGIAWPAGMLATAIAVAGLFTGPGHGGIDHPDYLASIAWVPLMVGAWERAVRGRDRRWLAVFALAAGAQWLVGYPEFPLDATVLAGVVALVLDAGPVRRRVGWFAAGCVLGVALGAVQLLPLAEAVRESYRVEQAGGSYPAARAELAVHSLRDVQRLLVDRAGAVAVVLAGLGVALGRHRRARLAWLAALVWAVFALNPPFSALYALPPYSDVRFPLGWSHLAPLFLGWLAAAGAHDLWSWGRPAARAAAGAHDLWSWGRPAARAAALVLGATVASQALAVIASAPTVLPHAAPPAALVAERMRALARLRAELDAPRVLPAQADLLAGAPLRYRLPSPAGFEPAVPPRGPMSLLRILGLDGWNANPTRVEVARHPDLAALLGVGVLAVPPGAAPEAAGFTARATLPGNMVALARPAVPRARLVHRVLEVASEGETLQRVVADGAADAVVLAGSGTPALMSVPADASETVRVVVDEPERVALDATVAADAMLVLTDTYYPGWYATVDGSPAHIWRADHMFRGILLGAGVHRVELRYVPRSFLLGAALSAFGLAIVGALLRPAARSRCLV
jgi:hypothetical protein